MSTATFQLTTDLIVASVRAALDARPIETIVGWTITYRFTPVGRRGLSPKQGSAGAHVRYVSRPSLFGCLRQFMRDLIDWRGDAVGLEILDAAPQYQTLGWEYPFLDD